MIFVDTNVFMYAVGRPHPLRTDARVFFEEQLVSGEVLVSSAEVLQELLHAYLPVARWNELDAAFRLARARLGTIWSVDPEDVEMASTVVPRYPGLDARDLVHRACCVRRGVGRIKTYDRALAASFEG